VGAPAPAARAVVLAAGGVRVGLVSLDLLSVPADVADEVRTAAQAAGLAEVWVTATHTHSSFGGYDARWASQLAGTARFRAAVRAAVVDGALGALRAAGASLLPVRLEVGVVEVAERVAGRSGEPADARLTRAVLQGAAGPVAELWHFAAHPTLEGRTPAALLPDFPGRLDAASAGGGPVRLLLQGAVGNVTAIAVPDAEGPPAEVYARALLAAAAQAPVRPVEGPVDLRVARVDAALAPADASRLLPAPLDRAGTPLLCLAVPARATLSALRLGPLLWVAMPFEPTSGAARVLTAQSGATGVVALADGYLGYLEARPDPGHIRDESARQYFAPSLLEALAPAAALAVRSVSP
jgi:hypothetical protein